MTEYATLGCGQVRIAPFVGFESLFRTERYTDSAAFAPTCIEVYLRARLFFLEEPLLFFSHERLVSFLHTPPEMVSKVPRVLYLPWGRFANRAVQNLDDIVPVVGILKPLPSRCLVRNSTGESRPLSVCNRKMWYRKCESKARKGENRGRWRAFTETGALDSKKRQIPHRRDRRELLFQLFSALSEAKWHSGRWSQGQGDRPPTRTRVS